MQKFFRGVGLGIVVLGLTGVQLPAQESDPLVGTWELNVAKSKYSPGPAPKSETRTYVVSGQDTKATGKGKVMTITTKGTNAAGQTINNVQVFEKR